MEVRAEQPEFLGCSVNGNWGTWKSIRADDVWLSVLGIQSCLKGKFAKFFECREMSGA